MRKQKILVIVKTYPEKSKKHGSSICSAGLTEISEWIRIYPIRLNIFQKKASYNTFSTLFEFNS